VAGKNLARALEFNCEHIVPEMENWIKAQLALPSVDAVHLLEHAQGKALRLTNKDERKVAAAVRTQFGKYSAELKRKAAQGVVDYGTTDELFAAMAKRLEPVMRDVYAGKIKATIAANDTPIDTEEWTTAAQDWARSYTFDKLKGELQATTIKDLQNTVSKLVQNPLWTTADINTSLFKTFSPYRAAMIATTEVTRAKAAAVNGYTDILTGYGDKVVRRWLTEADERVCPICGPLDRSLEKTYRKQWGDGPPAHPNCRCDIGVEVKQAGDDDDDQQVPTSTGIPFQAVGSVDALFVADMQKALAKVPTAVADVIRDAGIKTKVGNFVTEINPSTQGKTPRGWPPGTTWDNADGYFDSNKKEIGTTQYLKEINTGNAKLGRGSAVLMHETGHAYNYASGDPAQNDSAYIGAYKKDALALTGDVSKSALKYYLQSGEAGRNEAFAEAFSTAILGDGNNLTLAHGFKFSDLFPNVMDYMQQRIAK